MDFVAKFSVLFIQDMLGDLLSFVHLCIFHMQYFRQLTFGVVKLLLRYSDMGDATAPQCSFFIRKSFLLVEKYLKLWII